MADKKEVSAVVVKAFKSFSRYFRCLAASPDRTVGVLELNLRRVDYVPVEMTR